MQDHKSSSYYSLSGYRMWGGDNRVPARANHFAWISVGLMVGVAVVVATYFAISG